MHENMIDDTELLRADQRHALHPWGHVHPQARPDFMREGAGVHVIDGDGHRLLDAVAGLWCVNIGYGRPEMAEAIARQITTLPFYNTFGSMSHEPAARLSAELAAEAPGDLQRVFLTCGGSTANESAIRFLQMRANRRGETRRRHIITRADAYHGSTYLTASLSGKFSDRTDLDVIEDTVHHLASVNAYRRPAGSSIEEFRDARVAELERKILDLGPERVLAFIAEPILASGGVVVPPPGYHAKTLEVCRRYGVKYISDEVVTGFGRLGHLFSSLPEFGIVPDIITCAKGITSGYIPLGAALLSDELCREADGDGSAVFSNGYTYSAHPVGCAAALANLEILRRERLCEHVRELAPYFHQRLAELAQSPIVGDVRGMGLLAGIEFVADRNAKRGFAQDVMIGRRVADACRARGVIVRALGNTVGISPPLTISRTHVDSLAEALVAGVQSTLHDLVREGVTIGG